MAVSQGQMLAVAVVFIGCCTNVVTLESIIQVDRGAGNIVTFAQFVLIALEGVIITSRFFTRPSVVPLKYYALMVTMFFSVSVINNLALAFNIAMPLHMVFRASSLVANMILGIIILKKRYNLSKYISVLLITIGISLCTIVTGRAMKSNTDGDGNFVTWLIGICMLIFALFVSALMGVYQEVLYKQYGKQPREAMLWTHLMPLPGFLLLAGDISQHAELFSQTAPINFLGLFSMPYLWLLLVANTLTQYVCIRGVFYLTTACPSLTVTLIVTLRKFVSLIFSIFFFQNPFTIYHWAGTLFVFGGTMLFAEVLPLPGSKPAAKKE